MAEISQPEIAERGAVRGTVAAGGKRLEYEWLGPGPAAAPTLVFLHDGQGCVDTWRDFPAALAAATGCGALVYSRAGYGGSEGLPGPWPVSFMHDEALAALPQVVAALGVRDGFLVGHSDGASISLIHAATSGVAGAGAAGGWLRGMALEAPHVFVEPVCLESIAKLPALYRQPDLWRRMVRHHGANAQGCCESWVEVWLRPEFRSWSIAELLPRVRCPVLAIQGEQDPYGTLDQLRAVAAGCAGATETLVLPSCGHTPHRQQREATLAAMSGFLRRLL
ncbi:MAG TPA: alpha/beta hydrolase [Thermoanaerobaculia bacterium]|nr:alpha/beta hydrolase [Thermoanaerobaculia bacterium]